MKKILIADYTLRALSEGQGRSLLFREKVTIARSLKGFGADIVELAAVKNPKEDKIIYKTVSQALGSCRVSVPCGYTLSDMELAYECISLAADPCLTLELPLSDVQMEYGHGLKKPAMLAKAAELTAMAKSVCSEVEFVAGDATRADEAFLMEVLDAVQAAGASRICICDNEGVCLPAEITALVKKVKEHVSVPLFIRTSDSLSMATANALAGIEAGCDGVKCAVAGENVLKTDSIAAAIAGKSLYLDAGCGLELTEIHHDVESLLGRIGHGDYLSSGSSANADGEVFLDSASDISDVAAAERSLGYDLSDEDTGKVYDALKRICEKKSSIGAKELEAIIASSAMQAPSTYHLKSFNISTGNITSAMAHIVLICDDSGEISGVSTGDGPIDAAFRAIENCVGFHYELDDFQIQAVTEGKESLGASLVRLRSEGKLYSGNGLSTDIVGASIRAYINALNKIVYEESHK